MRSSALAHDPEGLPHGLARRASRRDAVLVAGRCARADPGLAVRLQSSPPALRLRNHPAGRIRGKEGLGHARRGGPENRPADSPNIRRRGGFEITIREDVRRRAYQMALIEAKAAPTHDTRQIVRFDVGIYATVPTQPQVLSVSEAPAPRRSRTADRWRCERRGVPVWMGARQSRRGGGLDPQRRAPSTSFLPAPRRPPLQSRFSRAARLTGGSSWSNTRASSRSARPRRGRRTRSVASGREPLETSSSWPARRHMAST